MTPHSALAFYASHGEMTDPGELAPLFDGLPRGAAALRDVVQGLLVHIFWASRCGLELADARKQEVQLRKVPRQLARLLELDPRPLDQARPLDRRLVGNCRDFSVLLSAMLRHQGVPARARCGFGAYFIPGHFEDHWVCECWDGQPGRWVLVDAQLDALQREAMRIPFDPLDVPRDQFLTGGVAWRLCRQGKADPDQFGIFDMKGLWFIRGDLLRDLFALNKLEILPWDHWGLMSKEEQALTTDDLALLDRVAELTLAGDQALDEIRRVCEDEPALRRPADWRS
jgi:hypothetical protein